VAREAQANLEREVLAARQQLGAETRAIAGEIASYALGRKVA
jgi:F0F1-type ATP synthase membrane subunit b/b'